MKQLEHRRAVEKLLEDRKARYEAEEEREILERKLEVEEAQKRSKLIEEERQKLIAKHAHNLLGYIPKGVLREEDIARLGDEFQDAYKKTSREEFESQYFL